MKDEAGRRGGIAASDAYAALQTKLEELDAYTHNVLHQFPRLERHLLCADMRGAAEGACIQGVHKTLLCRSDDRSCFG